MDKFAIRGVIQYFYLEGKKAKEIHDRIHRTLGEACPSYESVRRWVNQFKRGRASVENTYRQRRSKDINKKQQAEIIDKVRAIVMIDQQLKLTEIATAVGISERRANHIMRKELNMKKRSERWVPRILHVKIKKQPKEIMSEDSQYELSKDIQIEDKGDIKETSNLHIVDMKIKELTCEDIKEENDTYATNSIIAKDDIPKAKTVLQGKSINKLESFTDNTQYFKNCNISMLIKGTTCTMKEYRCTQCDQSFPHFHSLNAHRRQVHNQSKPEHSVKSETLDDTSLTVDIHGERDAKVYKKTNKYQCNTCLKICKNTKSLKNHISLVHMGLRRFACRLCHLRFAQKITLKTHERIHTGEKPYACYICDRRFAQLAHMNKHQKRHEVVQQKPSESRIIDSDNPQNEQLEDNASHENIHQCDICQKVFKRKSYLSQHILLIHRLRQFVCQFCGFQSTSKSKLKQHERIHTDEKSFESQNRLLKVDSSEETNQKEHNTKNIHQCDTCEKRFKRRSYLRQHVLLVHRLPQFVCQFCGFQSTSKSNLKQHERIHTGEKPLACDICGLRFRHYASIRKHRKTHKNNVTDSNVSTSEQQCITGDDVNIKMEFDITSTDTYERDTAIKDTSLTIDNKDKNHVNVGSHEFACRFCHLSFTMKLTLKTHERSHTHEKPYACNICDRRFLQLTHMTKHQKRHENDQRRDISRSDLIESNNLRNELLEDKTSLKTIKEIKLAEADNTKNMYQCETCQKKFKLKSYLRQHILLVHRIRQFTCQLCSFQSASKYNLQKHERIHTGEKPFTCDICSRCFRHSNSRKRHQATHKNCPIDANIFASKQQCKADDEMPIKMEIDTSSVYL